MIATSLSPCIIVQDAAAARDFYVTHFGATVNFDCGWYVDLHFGASSSSLQFMEPQSPAHAPFGGGGLTYNFAVDDVDAEHERLKDAGLTEVMPLEDHPWGDRGFAVLDPHGVVLYIYTETEPSEEFKAFYI